MTLPPCDVHKLRVRVIEPGTESLAARLTSVHALLLTMDGAWQEVEAVPFGDVAGAGGRWATSATALHHELIALHEDGYLDRMRDVFDLSRSGLDRMRVVFDLSRSGA